MMPTWQIWTLTVCEFTKTIEIPQRGQTMTRVVQLLGFLLKGGMLLVGLGGGKHYASVGRLGGQS